MKFKNLSEKLLKWLKYFSLNFFHNGYAREGAKRSSLNVLLGVIIAFVLICGGLTIGYNSSFNTHFDNAGKFNGFLSAASADTSLTLSDGKLTSDKVIETFADKDEKYIVNGYQLVIDTRPAAETFDDFSIICRNGDGKEISYEEYLDLSSSDKGKYSMTLKYGGKTLDTAEKQDVYRAYLDRVSDKNDEKYDEQIALQYEKLKESTLTEDNLNNEIYTLYAKAYYPSFEQVEKYGKAPTVRSYYLAELSSKKYGKYLMLFDDYCICSFYTDGGIAVSYSGDYASADGAVNDIGGLIKDAFAGNSAMNFVVFASDLFVSVIIFVILMLVVSLITARLGKKYLDYGGSTGIFNILGGFLPVSGIVAFIFGIALPYALAVNGAYLAVRLIFLSVVLIRFAVLIVMDVLKGRKNKTSPEVEEAAQTEPADPFEDASEKAPAQVAETADTDTAEAVIIEAEDKNE